VKHAQLLQQQQRSRKKYRQATGSVAENGLVNCRPQGLVHATSVAVLAILFTLFLPPSPTLCHCIIQVIN
jgi:hypothetical protein